MSRTALIAFVVALSLHAVFRLSGAAAEPQRPNVVLFLVDDLGLHDIGIEGSSFHQTPHIDALAKSGMRFTAGYANCRVCSPSRASIQLGTFPARHGITQWIGGKSGIAIQSGVRRCCPLNTSESCPPMKPTLAEALKAGGYQTSSRANGILAATTRCPPIMVLTSMSVAIIAAHHGRILFAVQKSQNGKRAPTANPSP